MGGVTTALRDQCSPAMKSKQPVLSLYSLLRGPRSNLQRESESLSAQIWAQSSFRFSSEALILQAQELYITLRSQDTLPPPGVFTLPAKERTTDKVWLCGQIAVKTSPFLEEASRPVLSSAVNWGTSGELRA